MKMNSTSVDTDNQYPLTQLYSRKEIYAIEAYNLQNPVVIKPAMKSFDDPLPDELKISTAARTTLQQEQVRADKSIDAEPSKSQLPAEGDDHIKIEILRYVLRVLSRKDYEQLQSNPDITMDKLKSLIHQAQISIKTSQSRPKQGHGLEMATLERHQEKDQLTIRAAGTIQNADGKRFDFNIQLKLDQQLIPPSGLNIPIGNIPKLNMKI
jgi:hypothetical protein